AKYWYIEQLLLGHDRSATGNPGQRHRRIDVRDVVRHEHVSPSSVELLQADNPHADSGQAYARPRTPHPDSVQRTNIARDQYPRKTGQGCNRQQDSPETEHEDGTDHRGLLLLLSNSQAARRAFCCAVTSGKSMI